MEGSESPSVVSTQMLEVEVWRLCFSVCVCSEVRQNGSVWERKKTKARLIRQGWRDEGGGRREEGDGETEAQREREGESMYSKCYISIQLLLLPLPPPVLLSPSHSPGSIYNSVGNCWVGFSEGSCCNWFRMQVVSLVMWEEGEDPGPVTRTGGFQTLTFCQIRFWVSGKKKKVLWKRFCCQKYNITVVFISDSDSSVVRLQ